MIVGVGVLMLVALWLLFGELEQINQTQHDNRLVGYGNRAAACQNLVAVGADVKAVAACQDRHVTPLYDQTAPRVIGSKADHEKTQRIVCTIAAGSHLQVPDCARP